MRTVAKVCMILAVVLMVISTAFQGLALASVTIIEDTPAKVFTENDWLIPLWMVALVLVPAGAVLTAVFKEKGAWLTVPLVVTAVGTVLSLIVALTLKNGLPVSMNSIGDEVGLTTWKLLYRHLSSVFAGVLVLVSAAVHWLACREEHIRWENEGYKPVYDLSGAPMFKDSDSTLDLEQEDVIPVKSTRKLKRSLRHKQNKG